MTKCDWLGVGTGEEEEKSEEKAFGKEGTAGKNPDKNKKWEAVELSSNRLTAFRSP